MLGKMVKHCESEGLFIALTFQNWIAVKQNGIAQYLNQN